MKPLMNRMTEHHSDCALHTDPERGACDCHVNHCGADAAELIIRLIHASDSYIAASPRWSMETHAAQREKQEVAYRELMRALNAAKVAGLPLPAAPAP